MRKRSGPPLGARGALHQKCRQVEEIERVGRKYEPGSDLLRCLLLACIDVFHLGIRVPCPNAQIAAEFRAA